MGLMMLKVKHYFRKFNMCDLIVKCEGEGFLGGGIVEKRRFVYVHNS